MATYSPICDHCKSEVVFILASWFHLDPVQETKCSGPYNIHLESPTLNDVMEFGHVIRVDQTGKVMPVPLLDCYAELNVATDGTDEFNLPEGWELLTGFTGQYSYNGPVMHPSEFIGGGLETYILETPGYYVALVVEGHCDYDGTTDCDPETGCDCDPAGWAIAYKAETGE